VVLPEFGIRITGSVFRAHNPEWAWNPLSGEGALRYGGRFNRVGVEALYTSLHVLTALREASTLGRPMQPLTLCEYAVDCDSVFDSRNSAAMSKEGLTIDELRCPAWERDMLTGRIPSSQAAAEHLKARGYHALLVLSFARGSMLDDVNLVFWNWRDSLPNKVTVIDSKNRLPRDRSSWPSSE
jgi:RES domain-containing protein